MCNFSPVKKRIVPANWKNPSELRGICNQPHLLYPIIRIILLNMCMRKGEMYTSVACKLYSSWQAKSTSFKSNKTRLKVQNASQGCKWLVESGPQNFMSFFLIFIFLGQTHTWLVPSLHSEWASSTLIICFPNSQREKRTCGKWWRVRDNCNE